MERAQDRRLAGPVEASVPVAVPVQVGARQAGLWLAWLPGLLAWVWGFAHLLPPLNHDAAAVLQFAERMVGGERLYVELFDMNPPMIFWLNSLPVLLDRVTGIGSASALIVCILLLVAGSSWLLGRWLRRLCGAEMALSALLIPSAALFLLLAYPAHSFAQREHLLAALLLPYLAQATARAGRYTHPAPVARTQASINSLPAQALVAGLAAIGLAMKPQFAAVFVLTELVVLARGGWRASFLALVPWGIGACLLAYLAASFLLHPDYFTSVIPFTQKLYAVFTSERIAQVLTGDQVPALSVAILLLGLAALLLPDRLTGRTIKDLTLVLTAAAAGTTLAGIGQMKGWDYHFLSARIFTLLLGASMLIALIDRAASMTGSAAARLREAGSLAVLTLLLLASNVLAPPFKAQRAFADSTAGQLLPVIAAEARGEKVLWLTTSISPQFPVLNYTDSPQAMRFMSLWMLTTLYANGPAVGDAVVYRAPSAMSPEERFVFNAVAEDFAANRPRLVVVAKGRGEPGFRGRRFDFIDYFARHPTFAAHWRHYEPAGQIANVKLYRRVD